jgi:hypothetical protein
VIAKAQDFSKLLAFGFIVLPPLGIIKAALIIFLNDTFETEEMRKA